MVSETFLARDMRDIGEELGIDEGVVSAVYESIMHSIGRKIENGADELVIPGLCTITARLQERRIINSFGKGETVRPEQYVLYASIDKLIKGYAKARPTS